MTQDIAVLLTRDSEARRVTLTIAWHLAYPVDPARPVLRTELSGRDTDGRSVSGRATLKLIRNDICLLYTSDAADE